LGANIALLTLIINNKETGLPVAARIALTVAASLR